MADYRRRRLFPWFRPTWRLVSAVCGSRMCASMRFVCWAVNVCGKWWIFLKHFV